MSKRDIKAKRWLKRRYQREYGEWWKPMMELTHKYAGKRGSSGSRMFICGRRPGMKTASEIWDSEYCIVPSSNTGAGK